MENITKSFSGNRVLHGVDFRLKRGSIHALLGENGTGKTTLMNILGGIIPGDKGCITVNEIVKEITGAVHGRNANIAFIHQELTLINDLSVCENLFLGCELKKGGILDKKTMYQRSQEILSKMEIDLDPKTMVKDIDASYKQVVEIARALMKEAKVIIMDEPTTALTNVEIEHVFKIMRRLRDQGVSFIFISHKLNEVIEICDSYTVMRDGRVISSDAVVSVNENMLACLMVGKELCNNDLYKSRNIGNEVLSVRKLSREREFKEIDFHVKKGEIVGFTGLLGDGRYELFSTIYGCHKEYQGEIHINGRVCKMNCPEKAHKNKISYLPRNRKENGIIKDLSVGENMTISIIRSMRKTCFIDKNKEKKFNTNYVDKLNIKINDLKELIINLSGGNQQKVILARALSSDPNLVILDNPTQGVDVGAKLEIYKIIIELAKQGMSFVVLSSEAQEVMTLCDRIYVMYHGEIRHEFAHEDANEEKIMIVATGGSV
jgi:ribose transport system ATP-binding protein